MDRAQGGGSVAMMTNKGSGGQYQPMSEINVTPFVDVMLVLLVIFMVTAPMMVQGLDVNMPSVDQSKPLDAPEEQMTVTLTKDRRVMLGDTEVAMDDLARLLKANEKIKKDKGVLLKADGTLPYEDVAKLMGLLQAGGVENIGMMMDSSGKRE